MSYEAWGEPDDSPLDAAIEAGWLNPDDISKAMIAVLNERDRQWNEEHFDPAHDDRHVKGELILAALCYSMNAIVHAQMKAAGADDKWLAHKSSTAPVPETWPWERAWWKPKDARRNLVRAAALIVAEIERMDRAEARKAQP